MWSILKLHLNANIKERIRNIQDDKQRSESPNLWNLSYGGGASHTIILPNILLEGTQICDVFLNPFQRDTVHLK